MTFFSELLVCIACLSIWLVLAVLVAGLLCWIFGLDKIVGAIERFLEFFGLDD